MALDTAIYPQDTFGYVCKELYSLGGWSYGFDFQEEEQKGFMEMLDSSMDHSLHGNWDSSSSSVMQSSAVKEWDPNSSPEACTGGGGDQVLMVQGSPMMDDDVQAAAAVAPHPLPAAKRKRRRTRTCKNKEELENQRMTHIAVERNRRKQMNDYLSVIRSLMPSSYVQRGDQASIIGGAINYVKELEQHLQTLEAKKRSNDQQPPQPEDGSVDVVPDPLFGDFFSFPQYSTRSSSHSNTAVPTTTATSEYSSIVVVADQNHRAPALADIEVTMAESHANIKILTEKRHRQLLKLVAGLQCLWLTMLHLNVTTADPMVLYSISVKLEDGCKLTTVDEIADAVNHLLGRIQEEAAAASS